MLKGGNHEASPLTTHGILIGIELEEGVELKTIMNRMLDSVSYMDGVGRVEAEHIGEMNDRKSLEEEVLDTIMESAEPVKES